MKIYTNKYFGQKIKFGTDLVIFKNEVAEVDDMLAQSLLSEGYAGIKDSPYTKEVSVKSGITGEQMDERNRFISEIERLKVIIANKEKACTVLKAEVAEWKSLVNSNENPEPPTKSPEPENPEPPTKSPEQVLNSMSKDEVVAFCVENKLGEKEALEIQTKKALIALILGSQ